ncbi:hypothetical protein ACH5RR_037313 [Cinchona calisaya]|uniref:CCHC-type domain-containing protein n=1 Tax=Cinchona calisaya TaxID=153742 RepID=A0ABD2YA33_9GENT
MKAGSQLVKRLKVDNRTALEFRGKFASLCVQINLNQPLKQSVLIGDYAQEVQYEGISFCYNCGFMGHIQESCEVSGKSLDDGPIVHNLDINSKVNEHNNAFGDWMKVKFSKKVTQKLVDNSRNLVYQKGVSLPGSPG